MKASGSNYSDTRWAVYENLDLGHPDAGQLVFLPIGPHNTFKSRPASPPDSPYGFGWRYCFIGWANLETGLIEEQQHD